MEPFEETQGENAREEEHVEDVVQSGRTPGAGEPGAAGEAGGTAVGAESFEGIKKIVKDAGAHVERLPGGKQMVEAVKSVADQVNANELAQKAMLRVREAADQVKQGAQDLDKNPLVIAAHKVLLAGVGAAALAQDEIEDFVNRLVERGQIAEADGKRMVKDVLDQRRMQMERAGEKAQDVVSGVATNIAGGRKRISEDLDQRVEAILTRMNIPTKDDIETLTAKITALTHKFDELKKNDP